MVAAATTSAPDPASAATDPAVQRIWAVLETVSDPEVPVLNIVELGIARAVLPQDGGYRVQLTPTYSGCPATQAIWWEVRRALDNAGYGDVAVDTVLSPAWTTDWLTLGGRDKLRAYGIAPPVAGGTRGALFGAGAGIACPRCASRSVELVSAFGSTACKALYRCQSCLEPFDYFKCH